MYFTVAATYTCRIFLAFYHRIFILFLLSTPDNLNLPGKLQKVRVIRSSTYWEFKVNTTINEEMAWERNASFINTSLQRQPEIIIFRKGN